MTLYVIGSFFPALAARDRVNEPASALLYTQNREEFIHRAG
jgi:hypothetical protein